MKHAFQSKLKNFHSDLWQYHLPVPEEVVRELTREGNKRIICTLNDSHTFSAALMKCQDYWFVLVNKKIKTTLRLNPESLVQVSLTSDFSEFGHSLPEPLQLLLEQDELFSKHFYALTKGKQRSLVYLTGKVKNPQSQLNKALAIMTHLKETGGELNFKQLNEKIIYFNNL
ncbi:DUF1905 domain-containing protein [Cyclobacterium salsum]|uniref:DUF1905 domain-containing protein n=1 Tax=Cyclobacterium salsum TaxID=2666329 RepID=UPI001390AD06|nr:DUF1905 domain-containing protein [Cyclobacterium salsum]